MAKKLYICIIFLIACSPNKISENIEKSNKTVDKATEVSIVEVVTLQKQSFFYNIKSQGKVESKQTSKTQFQKSGFLQVLNVHNGNIIGQGQLIASLENKAERIALEDAINETKIKTIAYHDMMIKYGVDKEEDLPPKIAERFKITSGLLTAKINLQKAKFALEKTYLYAPISGKISSINIKNKNQVTPNDVICEIYNHKQLVVITKLLESEINNIKIGQTVEIKPLTQDNDIYIGSIIEIDPKVNKKGLFEVKIGLKSQNRMMMGMNVACTIQVPQKSTLVVPKTAIVMRAGKKVVFTAENKIAKWNYVQTGLENENEVEINKGLEAGQNVIYTNNLQLEHETAIEIKREK